VLVARPEPIAIDKTASLANPDRLSDDESIEREKSRHIDRLTPRRQDVEGGHYPP